MRQAKMRARNAGASGIALLSMALIAGVVAGAADDPGAKPRAVTAADPAIPVDQLALLVKPLTVAELEVEAEAWRGLLRDKVAEISRAEIAAKKKREEIGKIKTAATAAQEADTAVRDAEKALEDARATGDAAAVQRAGESLETARKNAEKALRDAAEASRKTAEDAAVKDATEQAIEKAAKAPKEEEEPPPVKAEEAPDAAKLEKTAEKHSEVRELLLENLNTLREERTARIDRLGVVLNELELKGGAVDEYRKYVAAVSGIAIDVSDTSAALKAVGGWLTSKEGGVRWGGNALKFIAIVIAFWVLASVLSRLASRAAGASKRMSGLLRDFIVTSVYRVILFVGLVIALSALEVNIGPVLALIGAVGFVIGFALQGTLSNFASGLMILMYRPYDVGHVIDVAGVLGTVESMTLVSTKVRTPDNRVVVVPNNSIWGGIITNVTGTDRRRVDLVFGIGYSDDIAKAQGILESIVRSHACVLKDPEPVIKLHELGDSSVNFVVRPWARPDDYWTVYWDITRAVKEEFDRNGITIPFPQRDVHIYQETPSPRA